MKLIGADNTRFSQSNVIFPGEYPTSDARALAANREMALEYNFLALPTTFMLTAAADAFGMEIDKEKARSVYTSFGIEPDEEMLSGSHTFEGVARRAKIIKEQQGRQARIARMRSSTALSGEMLLQSFGMEFLNPINYATAGIGFMAAPAFNASIKATQIAGKAQSIKGIKKSYDIAMRYNRARAAQATTAQAFGRGAVEGGLGAAIVEAPTYAMANYAGYDYTMTDSLMSIAFGAPFGGIIHAAPKVFRGARERVHNERIKKILDSEEVKEIFSDYESELVDVNAISAARAMNADDELADIIGSVREVSGQSAVGDIAPTAKSQPLIDPAMAEAQRVATDLQRLKALATPASQKKQIRDAIGEEPLSLNQYIRRTGKISDNGLELASRDVKTFGKGAGLIDPNGRNLDDVILDVWQKGYFPEAKSRNDITQSMLMDAIAKDADEKNVFNKIYTRDVAERLAEFQAKNELRALDEYNRLGIDESMSVDDIAARLREISDDVAMENAARKDLSGVIAASDDVAERIISTSPNTRFGAQSVGLRQMAEGNPVNVEPVLKSDPRYGSEPPTREDLASLGEDYVDPARLAEFDEIEAQARLERPLTEDEIRQIDDDRAARKADEDIPFSRQTIASVRNAARRSFGRYTNKIFETAKMDVVQSVAELPQRAEGYPDDVAGVRMADGRVFLVADNIDPRENIQGLVLHEIGVHVGMRKMLGDKQFQRILDDVMSSDDFNVRQARKAVPEDTPPQHVAEEALAYLVQYAPHNDFVGNIIGAIKAWFMRTFGANLRIDEFTARHLAIGALRRVSELGDVVDPSDVAAQIGKQVAARKDAPAPKTNKDWIDGVVQGLNDAKGEMPDWFRALGEEMSVSRAKVNIVHKKMTEGKPLGRVEVRIAEAINNEAASLRSAMFSRATDGDQSVIPGAERISDRQLAERKMAESLKAKKPQKRMDEGLFAEPDTQTTLFSRAQKPDLPKRQTLAQELSPFDKMLKDVETYAPTIRSAVAFLDDVPGLRKHLDDGRVPSEVIKNIIAVAGKANRKAMKSARAELRKRKLQGIVDNYDTETDAIAKELELSIKEKINKDKLAAARNFLARERLIKRIRDFGTGFEYEAIASYIAGSAFKRQGARDNVASLHKAYTQKWVGALEAKMKKEGVWQLFASGAIERDVAKVLERLDDPTPDLAGLSKEAVKMGKILRAIQDDALRTQNSFGADIARFSNYVVRQSHDQEKIYKATFDEWFDFVFPRLDSKRTGLTSGKEREQLLEVYNQLASGKFEAEIPSEDTLASFFDRGRNLGELSAKSRELIFKRDAWFEYNQRFGKNTLAAAMIKSLDRAGQTSALMRTFGHNPMYNLQRVIDEVSSELAMTNPKAARRFDSGKQEALLAMMETVDGTANIPGNVRAAAINSNFRLLQMMSKLGGAVLGSLGDLGGYAANVRYEGRGNLYSGLANAIKSVATNYDAGSTREIYEGLGITFDHTIANIVQQFSKNGTLTDNIAASARVFTKLNLQQQWTVQLQKGSAIGLSNYIGKNAGKNFDALSDDMKRMFEIHNITPQKWDVIRKATREAEDGRFYIDVRSIEQMDDATISDYITKSGRTVSPKSIASAKEALADDMRAMFIDRSQSGTLSSDARVQAAMVGRTKRGSLWGEVVRYIGQFKSFPVMMYERVLKREIYGRGYDSLADYAARGKGDMVGFVNFLGVMTLLGYASMTIKDMIAQKEPRPLDNPGTWLEAMRRGGAMGLYGDFLFAEYDRYTGANLADAVLGPAFGAAGDIFEIATAAANGDKFATKAIRTLQANMPGANLFYVKPVLDNLFMWNLMESMNPGYLKRMQRHQFDRTGAHYYAPPSQTTLRY